MMHDKEAAILVICIEYTQIFLSNEFHVLAEVPFLEAFNCMHSWAQWLFKLLGGFVFYGF